MENTQKNTENIFSKSEKPHGKGFLRLKVQEMLILQNPLTVTEITVQLHASGHRTSPKIVRDWMKEFAAATIPGYELKTKERRIGKKKVPCFAYYLQKTK